MSKFKNGMVVKSKYGRGKYTTDLNAVTTMFAKGTLFVVEVKESGKATYGVEMYRVVLHPLTNDLGLYVCYWSHSADLNLYENFTEISNEDVPKLLRLVLL